MDSPATKPTVLAIKDEEALVGHILRMEERGFGLTITDVRKLAYEIAVRSGRKHCFNNDKKSAGYDWWQGFRDRHPCLSVRIPEGLSAARSSMLNPNVISAYFQKLGSFMDKLNIKDKPQQIFNADETGVSTVHDPSKVVGKRGKKSVNSKTSGERGENVTALCCVNAEARVLPPMLIFKGQRVSQALIGNAPANTLFACSKSSFIDSDLFNNWFKKLFIPNLPPQRPVLLILDVHSSHITVDLLETAVSNQIVLMFCLPPHTTHWTQPLDRSVFGPLKRSYNLCCEAFLRQNPGRIVTRYDFCGLFKQAFNEKMNLVNIFSGFRATGIFPFKPNAIPIQAYGPPKTSVLQVEVEASIENGHDVSKDQNQSRLTTTANEEQSVSAVNPQVPSTSSEKTYLREILRTPEVVKQRTEKKTKRVTEARCLTEREFFNELKRKEEEKNRVKEGKDQRKMEREEKKKKKELDQTLKKRIKANKNTMKRLAKNKENDRSLAKDQSDSTCTYCNGNYMDDKSHDEDWVKCTRCSDWYHESCTGKFGHELSHFVCNKH
ncbi:uncharacterized protein [Mytilus edulis]|uniref:uncharacterized protein n=1 Tax=Mytilus edulis TaxID=6550 RepID=UPI0039EFFF22